MLQYMLPVWLFAKITKVWFHVSTQNSKGCWFASSILTDKSKNFIRSRDWKSMKFEGVLSISVSNLTRKTLRQINDFNGSVWASFDAHTATDAEVFRNLADSWCLTNLNAEFSCLVDRARLLALLCTFLWFTFIRIDNSNPKLIVSTRWLHAICSL